MFLCQPMLDVLFARKVKDVEAPSILGKCESPLQVILHPAFGKYCQAHN